MGPPGLSLGFHPRKFVIFERLNANICIEAEYSVKYLHLGNHLSFFTKWTVDRVKIELIVVCLSGRVTERALHQCFWKIFTIIILMSIIKPSTYSVQPYSNRYDLYRVILKIRKLASCEVELTAVIMGTHTFIWEPLFEETRHWCLHILFQRASDAQPRFRPDGRFADWRSQVTTVGCYENRNDGPTRKAVVWWICILASQTVKPPSQSIISTGYHCCPWKHTHEYKNFKHQIYVIYSGHLKKVWLKFLCFHLP